MKKRLYIALQVCLGTFIAWGTIDTTHTYIEAYGINITKAATSLKQQPLELSEICSTLINEIAQNYLS